MVVQLAVGVSLLIGLEDCYLTILLSLSYVKGRLSEYQNANVKEMTQCLH
jgi:hypothetical protein